MKTRERSERNCKWLLIRVLTEAEAKIRQHRHASRSACPKGFAARTLNALLGSALGSCGFTRIMKTSFALNTISKYGVPSSLRTAYKCGAGNNASMSTKRGRVTNRCGASRKRRCRGPRKMPVCWWVRGASTPASPGRQTDRSQLLSLSCNSVETAGCSALGASPAQSQSPAPQPRFGATGSTPFPLSDASTSRTQGGLQQQIFSTQTCQQPKKFSCNSQT